MANPTANREPDREPGAVSVDENASDAVTAADTTETAAPTDTDEDQTDENQTDDPDILVSDDLVFEEAATPDPDDHTDAPDDDVVTLDVPEPSESLSDTDLVLEEDAPPDGEAPAPAPDSEDETEDETDDRGRRRRRPLPRPRCQCRDEPLVWSDAWSVGAPDMDGDHRILVNLINTLPQAVTYPRKRLDRGQRAQQPVGLRLLSLRAREALLRAAQFPRQRGPRRPSRRPEGAGPRLAGTLSGRPRSRRARAPS